MAFCTICGESFTMCADRDWHIIMDHREVPPFYEQCPKCGLALNDEGICRSADCDYLP